MISEAHLTNSLTEEGVSILRLHRGRFNLPQVCDHDEKLDRVDCCEDTTPYTVDNLDRVQGLDYGRWSGGIILFLVIVGPHRRNFLVINIVGMAKPALSYHRRFETSGWALSSIMLVFLHASEAVGLLCPLHRAWRYRMSAVALY